MSLIFALKNQDILKTSELLDASINAHSSQSKEKKPLFSAEFFAKEVVYYCENALQFLFSLLCHVGDSFLQSDSQTMSQAKTVQKVTNLFYAIGGAVRILYGLKADEPKCLWGIFGSRSWRKFWQDLQRQKIIYRDYTWNEMENSRSGPLFFLIHESFGIREKELVRLARLGTAIEQLDRWGVQVPRCDMLSLDQKRNRNAYVQLKALVEEARMYEVLVLIDKVPARRFDFYQIVSDNVVKDVSMMEEPKVFGCVEKIARLHNERHVLPGYPGLFVLIKQNQLINLCEDIQIRLNLEKIGYDSLPELYECYTDVIERFLRESSLSLKHEPNTLGRLCKSFENILAVQFLKEKSPFRLVVSDRFKLNWVVHPDTNIELDKSPKHLVFCPSTPSYKVVTQLKELFEVEKQLRDATRIAMKIQIHDEWTLIILAYETGHSRQVFVLDVHGLRLNETGKLFREVFRHVHAKILALNASRTTSFLEKLIPHFSDIGFKLTDVSEMVESDYPGVDISNLNKLVQQVLGIHLDTRALYSDWNRRPLRKIQLDCEARCATVLFDLYDALGHQSRR